MNYNKIFFVFFILISFTTSAQFVNGNNNRYGGMQNNYQTPSKPSPAILEKEKNEKIEKYIEKLNKELTLDELQYIAIKKEIISNSKNVDNVMKKELSEEIKAKEITFLIEQLDQNIKSYLNDSQKEKYQILRNNKDFTKK